MKICPVGAKLFHAHRQTDMMKLIVALCKFVNMPKSGSLFSLSKTVFSCLHEIKSIAVDFYKLTLHIRKHNGKIKESNWTFKSISVTVCKYGRALSLPSVYIGYRSNATTQSY